MFFQYGEKEITYLKQKDKCLAEVIDKIGRDEPVYSDPAPEVPARSESMPVW